MKNILLFISLLCSFIAVGQITDPGSCRNANQLTHGLNSAPISINIPIIPTSPQSSIPSGLCYAPNSSVNKIIWFKFTANTSDILLNIKFNLSSNLSYIVISNDSCPNQIAEHCTGFDVQANTEASFFFSNLRVGQSYKLLLLTRANRANFDLSLQQISPNRIPKMVISTRRGGSWSSPSTWVGRQIPLPGDSVVIDDSASVTASIAGDLAKPAELSYLKIGRGLTNHRTSLGYLALTPLYHIAHVTGDVEIKNGPVSLNFITISTDGNLLNNGQLTPAENNYMVQFRFTGDGQRQVKRTVSSRADTTTIQLSINNPRCTLSVDFPLLTHTRINLDSGYFNNISGVVLSGRTLTIPGIDIVNPIIKVAKGKWLGSGPMQRCNTCLSMGLEYGTSELLIDSIAAGNEWPSNTRLRSFSATNVSLLRGKRIDRLARYPIIWKSFVQLPQDSIIVNSGYRFPSIGTIFTDQYFEDNLYSGMSPTTWINPRSLTGPWFAGNVFSSLRGMRHFLITGNVNTGWTTKVHDQSPGQLTATFTGDLTALRGKSYVQLTGTGTVQDSVLVTMMLHPTDSLQDSRWDLCLAQAPNPGGPWKAVSPRDSSFSTRNFRRARVRFADGPYFAIGSRQLELNVKLNRLILPSSYEAGCVTSTGLPLTFIVENLGARAIDSIELGFRTNNQLVTTIVRLTRPLPSMGYDTLVMEGPLGLDATTTTSQPLKAWVAYPGAGNLFDDTIKTVFTVVSPSLPFLETFDTISSATSDRARILNQSPVAGWHVRYNPTNHYRNSTDLARGYAIRHTGSGNKVLGWRLRSPITEAAVTTPGLNLSAGRWYLGYNMAEDLFSGTQVDSFRVQYSTDCGFSWGTIKKRSLQDLGRCCAVRPFNNSIVAVDSIDLSTAARTSFRLVVDNAHLYYLSLSAVQVSSTLTSLSVPIASKEASWYPNPATDAITYEGAPGNLRIISTTGKVLMQKEGLAFGETIMLTGLPSGIYLLQVQTGYGLVSKRVVKR